MQEDNSQSVALTETGVDTSTVSKSSLEVAQRIIDSSNVEEIKDLTHLFNLNMRKKSVVRVIKMNDLLDKVTDSVIERFEKTPHNFSNDDLIKYMQVTESAIERANKQLNLVEETPPIQLQHNEVTVNIVDNLDRESRARIADAVRDALSRKMNSSAIEVKEVEEIDNNG